MRRRMFKDRHFRTHAVLAAAASMALASSMRSQEIEPRLYANAPIGVNFVIGGFAGTQNGFPIDVGLPVTDPELNTYSLVMAYARVIDLWGCSAKLSAQAPYTFLKGSATYGDDRFTREVNGITDARVRLAVNLYGAPAMKMKDFASYRQDLVIGASASVIAPTGQYDPERLVNIGANRWSFMGDLGASKALGRWIAELSTALQAFTTNTAFFGTTRRQEPLVSFKSSVIRNFPKGAWASVDATYFTGGASDLGSGTRTGFQSNWRTGATFSMPLGMHHSIKLFANSGVYARTGNNFDMVGLIWQYRWGGRP
jgi:hypothetical protein